MHRMTIPTATEYRGNEIKVQTSYAAQPTRL